jgi:hypothetical protein
MIGELLDTLKDQPRAAQVLVTWNRQMWQVERPGPSECTVHRLAEPDELKQESLLRAVPDKNSGKARPLSHCLEIEDYLTFYLRDLVNDGKTLRQES